MQSNKKGKGMFSMGLDQQRANRITILSKKHLVKRVSSQLFLSFSILEI